MDTSIQNMWHCWYLFRKGKKKTREFYIFEYELEKNLFRLQKELLNGRYKHERYSYFTVFENKKREIVVASIKDRVVHRMIYEYLLPIFDKTFIYDVWSCRKNKGLLGAIERTQQLSEKYSNSYVWRADIKKFFDSVNQEVLMDCIKRRVSYGLTLNIIQEIINSYSYGTPNTQRLDERAINEREKERESKIASRFLRGIPIGNLTSQIFSNIYLNELDRFVIHKLKPKAYLRYGDDFIVFENSKSKLEKMRILIIDFLMVKLSLKINQKNNIIIKPKHGIKFLGVDISPYGRRLKKKNWNKIQRELKYKNLSSYLGLVKKHSNQKRIKEIQWRIKDVLDFEM